MDRQEAHELAARITSECGWHAEVDQNTWSGEWYVEVWQDDMVDSETGERATYRFSVMWPGMPDYSGAD